MILITFIIIPLFFILMFKALKSLEQLMVCSHLKNYILHLRAISLLQLIFS